MSRRATVCASRREMRNLFLSAGIAPISLDKLLAYVLGSWLEGRAREIAYNPVARPMLCTRTLGHSFFEGAHGRFLT